MTVILVYIFSFRQPEERADGKKGKLFQVNFPTTMIPAFLEAFTRLDKSMKEPPKPSTHA